MCSKRVSLSDLKKHITTSSARTPAGRIPAPQRPRSSRSDATNAAEDLEAFQRSVAGARLLKPSNRAELKKPAPSPVRRPRDAEPDAVAPTTSNNELNLPAAWLSDEPAETLRAEDAVLAAALRGVVPIKTDRVPVEPPKPAPIPRQHELDEQAALAESIYAPTPLELRLEGGDELNYLKDSMPRSVLRDLRRGRWVVQAALDLHGANREEAREMLAAFMGHCRKNGIRCVRVIHGKGLGSPGKEPVLKKLVAGWLMNYDDVLAYAQARVHDGGAGAMLVLLRAQNR